MKKPKSSYEQATHQVNQLKSIARISGMFSPKIREKWNSVQRQFESIEAMKRQMELFSTRYSPLGWALYDRMSTVVLGEIEHATVDVGEASLTQYHMSEPSRTQLRYRFMTPQFEPWLHIYEAAMNRVEAEDWLSAAPLLLICIDGVLTTTTGKHPFSGGGDAEVFDTITSEPGGLSDGLRVLGATRRKLSTAPIDAPFRHGIVHGLNPQYGSAIVVAKTINLLQATVDYVQNLGDESQRLEKARKEQEPPSWRELRTQLAKSAAARAAYHAWRPRESFEGVVASNGSIVDLAVDSPEKSGADYLILLSQSNYGALASATIDYALRPIGHRAGLLRKDLQGLSVAEWTISNLKDTSAATATMEVQLVANFKGESRKMSSQLRMMYTDENHEAMARSLPGGSWRAMANLTTDLWRLRIAER
jgi:hypothetical protein